MINRLHRLSRPTPFYLLIDLSFLFLFFSLVGSSGPRSISSPVVVAASALPTAIAIVIVDWIFDEWTGHNDDNNNGNNHNNKTV